MRLKFIFYSVILICFNAGKLYAQSVTNTADSTKILTIGIPANEVPFSFLRDSIPTGIALEIWEDIARKKSWNYKYVTFESVKATLDALKKERIDVAVGSISITSNRLKDVPFSQPFYNSGLAIVSRVEGLSWWQKIQPFFSLQLLGAVLAFVLILVIVGTFLCLAERKKSDQFPSYPLNGIGNGMWLAIVTMSTTGYGDKAPVTLIGRIIAGIASTLTISSLGKKQ